MNEKGVGRVDVFHTLMIDHEVVQDGSPGSRSASGLYEKKASSTAKRSQNIWAIDLRPRWGRQLGEDRFPVVALRLPPATIFVPFGNVPEVSQRIVDRPLQSSKPANVSNLNNNAPGRCKAVPV